MANFYGRPGARNLNAKAKPHTVAVMRRLSRYNGWTRRRIADEFDLSVTATQKILSGQSWADTDEAAEISKLRHLVSLLDSVEVDSQRGDAWSGAETCTTLRKERVQTYPNPSEQGHKRTPVSLETVQPYNLQDVLLALGIEHLADLTQELLDSVPDPHTKSMLLADFESM